jgi:diketogulonate reductase-like aldo/keto reductase
MIATLNAGTVEYDRSKASIPIDELIEALEEAREEGATEVVGLSGNFRGAQYVRLGRPYIADEEF